MPRGRNIFERGGEGYLIVSIVKAMLMIDHNHIADFIGNRWIWMANNGPNYNEQGKMMIINWPCININSPIRRISNLVFAN